MEEPSLAPFLERMASFSRLIILDRRGTGLSDPVENLPTLEERMDDVRAVMDAAGSKRAFLFGASEGGPLCALFAATYPERAAGLILGNTSARWTRTEDYPWAPPQESMETLRQQCQKEWGTGVSARNWAPSRAADEAFVRSWARFERRAVSPSGVAKILAMVADTDVRHVLPLINVPTLVIQRTGDWGNPVEGARYIAQHITGARLVEVPGIDHYMWVGDSDAILDEVERFVTGTLHTVEVDRILATVLFVDMVDSTRHLVKKGDRVWREFLERFFGVLRGEINRFRGREIDTSGDGILATFDGPARAIRCACAMNTGVRSLGIEIRAGLHSGECELAGDSVRGIAVHIGARVAATAGPSEILVSSTVKDLVAGSGIRFTDRGAHALKGVPGEWRLFAASA
ncbi:MAG TPA: adenylate/guanylate cyclase domain-containing protein [Candidatus Binataceae bacterium]